MRANASEWRDSESSGSARRNGAPPARLAASAVAVAVISCVWFVVIQSELSHAMGEEAAGRTIAFTALVSLGARLAGLAIETLFYTCFWRALLVPASFARLALAIYSLSMLDALAVVLTRWGLDAPTPRGSRRSSASASCPSC